MKYSPSAVGFGEMRGTAGSTVASRNRSGPYIRNHATPVDPHTFKQVIQRNTMQNFSNVWRTLTAAQRLQWTNLGLQIVRTDPLGNTYNLTGFEAFLMAQRNLFYSNFPATTTAPPLANPSPPTSMGLTVTTVPLVSVTFAPVSPSGTRYVVEMTKGVSAGKTFMPRSEYKLIKVLTAAATSPQDVTSEYLATYGGVLLGEKIFARIRPFTNTGFTSVGILTSAIVA